MGKINSKIVKAINQIESKVENKKYWSVSDSYTVATMIWPEMIKNTTVSYAQALDPMNGVVKFQYNNTKVTNNVELVTSLNVTMFQEKLKYHFQWYLS